MNRTRTLEAVQTIVGKAARDALDFKLCDSTSVTTTANCIQDNFEAVRNAALTLLARQYKGYGGTDARIAREEEFWAGVREALASIGFSF